jgi:hypothetical protein
MPQGSPAFRIFRFGGRHHSTVLKEEFHRHGVLLEVKQSQRGRVGTQLPCNGSHHLPNEVIQLVRSSPARVQWTQIVWFVNRHLTLSTAYSHLFAGYYLHDIGKQDVGFVAVWLNYRFWGQQIPQLEEDD